MNKGMDGWMDERRSQSLSCHIINNKLTMLITGEILLEKKRRWQVLRFCARMCSVESIEPLCIDVIQTVCRRRTRDTRQSCSTDGQTDGQTDKVLLHVLETVTVVRLGR